MKGFGDQNQVNKKPKKVMKKLSVILVLSLILFTALIKNSTKRIDDEISFKVEPRLIDSTDNLGYKI